MAKKNEESAKANVNAEKLKALHKRKKNFC